MTDVQHALIHAWTLSGDGGGRRLEAADLARALHDRAAPLWLHLDRSAPGLAAWLTEVAAVPEAAVRALLAEDTRPRFEPWGEAALVNLRGVNLNPGASPEDMLSLRLWVTDSLVISFRRYPIMAVRDMDARLESGHGPCGVGQFVAMVAEGLTARMAPFLSTIDDEIEALEDLLEAREQADGFTSLRPTRRRAGILRRFLSPQQSAVARIAETPAGWLTDTDRISLRQTADDVLRFVEDLDSVRERATFLMDALDQQQAERTNRTMYLLTVVAGIFLPLGFLTGLLGINVGGMPGTDSDAAFWIVCGLLTVVVMLEVLIFRRKRWI
ncbi:Magnesium and cobalt transport protein CorA [Caenispirillum salinarum AK4]|uniref:Magnesium and cobalt transport protein CorA n=1 Tax=Caenispirillum salinarum AK4 TaxID=1238182 RepID=K9GYG1_9PROT|nr:zinc transporter ZntB [Caenispirillum salinarum]EKV29804.1 Magnesium and cobalt transport protein CorA [Caenispirillum salinarum AK4]